jgi:hypothetical protein
MKITDRIAKWRRITSRKGEWGIELLGRRAKQGDEVLVRTKDGKEQWVVVQEWLIHCIYRIDYAELNKGKKKKTKLDKAIEKADTIFSQVWGVDVNAKQEQEQEQADEAFGQYWFQSFEKD